MDSFEIEREIYFNPQHPPPGTRPGEDIRSALARYRNIFLSLIPTRIIGSITLIENGSVLTLGAITDRLSAMLVNEEVPGDELYVDVRAPSDSQRLVTTSDIVDRDGHPAPIVSDLDITALNYGKRFAAIFHVEVSTKFSPVTRCYFQPIKNTRDYRFVIVFKEGFRDVNGAIEVANEIAEDIEPDYFAIKAPYHVTNRPAIKNKSTLALESQTPSNEVGYSSVLSNIDDIF